MKNRATLLRVDKNDPAPHNPAYERVAQLQEVEEVNSNTGTVQVTVTTETGTVILVELSHVGAIVGATGRSAPLAARGAAERIKAPEERPAEALEKLLETTDDAYYVDTSQGKAVASSEPAE